MIVLDNLKELVVGPVIIIDKYFLSELLNSKGFFLIEDTDNFVVGGGVRCEEQILWCLHISKTNQ